MSGLTREQLVDRMLQAFRARKAEGEEIGMAAALYVAERFNVLEDQLSEARAAERRRLAQYIEKNAWRISYVSELATEFRAMTDEAQRPGDVA